MANKPAAAPPKVPPGWSPAAWRRRLEYLAAVTMDPALAEQHRQAAAGLAAVEDPAPRLRVVDPPDWLVALRGLRSSRR